MIPFVSSTLIFGFMELDDGAIAGRCAGVDNRLEPAVR